MASTRWLLVLILWLLPWLQMAKCGFSYQQFQSSPTWNTPMVIPKDGVYLVSIIVVPCDNCQSTLQVYCQCQGRKIYFLTAYGRRISSHAEVAADLKKNDKLILKNVGEIKSSSSLSVVYVAEPNSFYITMMNGFLWTEQSPVVYTAQLGPKGWTTLRNPSKKSTFRIPTTGMYWVTARPKPYLDPVTASVRIKSKVLFTVYAEDTKTLSTSGAFRLAAGSEISMVTDGKVTYEPHTLLSFVYLVGNKKNNTYPFEHLAFTAVYEKPRRVKAQEVLLFPHVLTNYGYLYIDGYTEIRRTGSYMISIRPDPETDSLVIVNLYVNGTFYWVMYAENGVPTGATISLSLQVGSYLEVRNSQVSELGTSTMFSIAFIQP